MAKARAKGRPIAPLELSAEERTYLVWSGKCVATASNTRLASIIDLDCLGGGFDSSCSATPSLG